MKEKILLTFLILALLTGAATAQKSVQMEVQKVNMEPVPLQTSEYADIWLEVVNTGDAGSGDVRAEFVESFPFSIDEGEKSSWNLSELEPGERKQIHMKVRVADNAVQGENDLKLRTSYGDLKVTHDIPLEVRSDNDILSVSEVDFPGKVAPGSQNEMSLQLENLADGQMKNIDVKLDLSGIPVAASDTTSRTVTDIDPDRSESISYSLNVDESAENGVYKIPVEISYENEAGNEFTRQTTIGAVVGGNPELEVGLNSVEDELTPGSTGSVTVRIVNRGRGSADFVKVAMQETENLEVLSTGSVYLGDMDADDYQTADFQVHVDSEAENVSAPVEVTYKDVSGEQVETQQVDIPVYSQQQLERYGMSQSGSILPVVVLILIAAGGIYYWRRRR